MSPWRFRYSSTQSLPEVTYPSSGGLRGDDNKIPPRYSNLTSLAESQAASSDSSGTSPASVDNAERVPPRLSAMSLGSQVSSPSYRTNDPETLSIHSSTTTLTNPPRYSTLSLDPRGGREGACAGRRAVSTSEYTFDIISGFKSERWATLRLYDAKSSSYRGPKKGRHPRVSNMDTMLGNVELHLSSPQTIKSIELTLKGCIITGAIGDGGSTTFLEQGYTLWDCKFGDPRLLTDDDHTYGSSKYDGKLSGNWVFSFSIPFPRHVDLSTLRAVYPGESEGPVRFRPELLHEESPLTPFDLSGRPTGMQSNLHSAPVHPPDITPFDVRTPSMPTEKGRLVLSHTNLPTQAPMSYSSPISPPSPTGAPGFPSLEPYTSLRSDSRNPPSHCSDYAMKPGRSPPVQGATATHGHQRPRGATRMGDPKFLTTTTGHPLPQSFLERDVMANIQYEMTLTITHGRFSTKSRVSTPVVYTPITVPPSMTLGRQRAYQQRQIPPSPALDPGGWSQLPPVLIQGTLNGQKSLILFYTLSLAMPLSYVRGTVIPFYLSVACDDANMLNLFADPRAPRVRLRQSIRFLQNQAGYTQGDVAPDYRQANFAAPGILRISKTPLQLARRKEGSQSGGGQLGRGPTGIEPFMLPPDDGDEIIASSDEANARDIGDGAVWCTPTQLTQEPRVKWLYGEIHLPRGLQQTCKCPLFNILYHVELLAPATNAFVPDMQSKLSPRKDKSGEGREGQYVYLSQPVEITTDARKDEPAPIPFVWVTDPVNP